jgi:hypothetical protein
MVDEGREFRYAASYAKEGKITYRGRVLSSDGARAGAAQHIPG